VGWRRNRRSIWWWHHNRTASAAKARDVSIKIFHEDRDIKTMVGPTGPIIVSGHSIW